MKILVINGVNLNMLGIREKNLYGEKTYKDLVEFIKAKGKEEKVFIKCVQSNYEGKIVEFIQKSRNKFDGIIINAGAYTHTSIAILDALKAVNIPTIEVHMTNIHAREDFRHTSLLSGVCKAIVAGFGENSYILALEGLVKLL